MKQDGTLKISTLWSTKLRAEMQNVCRKLKGLNGKRQNGPPHQIFPSLTHDDPSQFDNEYFMMRTALTSQTAAGVNH